MEIFPDVSIHVAQEVGKGELQHVHQRHSIVEFDQLSVVKDEESAKININELLCGEKLEIAEDWNHQEDIGLKVDETKKLDLGIGGELTRAICGNLMKGMLNMDLKSNSKVTWSANFDKLTWKKLRNKQSLIEHLTNGKLDINHELVKRTYYETPYLKSCFGRYPVLKVVDSIVYTNSDTVVSITTEPSLDVSVKTDLSSDTEMESKGLKANATCQKLAKKTVETTLPANTVMAYGCVNLVVDMSNGKMTVGGKGGFFGNPAKDTNCASEGTQPSSSGATSSTKEAELEQDNARLQEAYDKLQKWCADRNKEQGEMEMMIADRDKTIADQVKTIADKDKTNAAKDKMIAAKDELIAAKDKTIAKLGELITKLQVEIRGLEGKIKGLVNDLVNQELGLEKEIVERKVETERLGEDMRKLKEYVYRNDPAARNETPSTPASTSLEEANGGQADDAGTFESTEATDNDAREPGNGVQEEKPQNPYELQQDMRPVQTQPQGTTDLGQQQE